MFELAPSFKVSNLVKTNASINFSADSFSREYFLRGGNLRDTLGYAMRARWPIRGSIKFTLW